MCDHSDLSLEVDPHAYDDTRVMTLVIAAVSCRRCGVRFRFLGVSQRPSLVEPTAKDNARRVILPMLAETEQAALAS